MKKLIATIILWAGLWNAPSQAQCEQGQPGGGSYSYNPGDSTGTLCAIWEVSCGQEVTFYPQSVMDYIVLLDENSNDTLVKGGFGILYPELFPLSGETNQFSNNIPEFMRTGVVFDVAGKTIFRNSISVDWVKVINIENDLLIGVYSNDTINTSWSIKIKDSQILSTKTESIVLCIGQSKLWVSSSSYSPKVWNTPNGEYIGDSVNISQPGIYYWESVCGLGDFIEVSALEGTSSIISRPIHCTDSVELSILTNGLVQWSNGMVQKDITVKQGNYSVTVTDSYGNCPFVLDTTVWYPSTSIYVPSAFSPNGDGINDCFRVEVGPDTKLESFELKVFDRWGELIFSSTDPAGCWDGNFRGKPMPQGSYAYRYKNKDCGGQGFVTLVR